MAKKIFVSYKYADYDVRKITNNYGADTVRDYVNKLEEIIYKNDIYKGESDNNDLSQLSENTIWNELKQKIFDSSITIVLISPKMKNLQPEKDQWIPNEISYSLKEISHDNKTSRTNALIFIVLPDMFASYDYFIKPSFINIDIYDTSRLFSIMKNNLNNSLVNDNSSYATIVKWDEFIRNYTKYINIALEKQDNIYNYKICKTI